MTSAQEPLEEPARADCCDGLCGTDRVVPDRASSEFPRRTLLTQVFHCTRCRKTLASMGDTGPVKMNHLSYARKSDGSWADVATIESPDGQVGELRLFVDVASSRHLDLEPFTRSAMTLSRTKRAAA